MKNTQIRILLFCSILISCSTDSTNRSAEDSVVATTDNSAERADDNQPRSVKIPGSDVVPDKFFETCQVLYEKVCFGLSSPDPVLDQSGIYMLDLASYKDKLHKLGIFTEAFIQRQDEIFFDCNAALLADSITPEKAEDGIDVNAPSECSFFHYAYYFNSQEYPSGFYLRKSKVGNEKGSTELHYYTSVEDSFFTWDQDILLKIELEKAKDQWLISDIQKAER